MGWDICSQMHKHPPAFYSYWLWLKSGRRVAYLISPSCPTDPSPSSSRDYPTECKVTQHVSHVFHVTFCRACTRDLLTCHERIAKYRSPVKSLQETTTTCLWQPPSPVFNPDIHLPSVELGTGLGARLSLPPLLARAQQVKRWVGLGQCKTLGHNILSADKRVTKWGSRGD